MACVEVTRGTAYGLAMSQAALTLGVTLFCPSVHGGHYIPIPRFENTTLSPGLHLDLYYMDVRLSLLLLAGSLVALCFSFSTHSLQEQNVLHADYSADAMDQAGVWDLLFWAFFALSHGFIILLLTTPIDTFACILSVVLMAHFAHLGCAPRPSYINITRDNFNLLGYFLGFGIMAYSIQKTGTAQIACMFLMASLDYGLALGHTYDRQATLDTVTNCRLFYACAVTLGLCGVYAFWYDLLSL